jgi:Host cell surface-exposed lipoprotein
LRLIGSSNTGNIQSTVGVTPTTTKSGFTPAQDSAIAKAKSYLAFTSFSQSGLVSRLEFDGFTPSQAQYGASAAYGG